jgi:hypothetical protein
MLVVLWPWPWLEPRGMQVAVDANDADAAAVMAFYKYADRPILQLLMSLRRTPIGDSVTFASTSGMPLLVEFALKAIGEAQTEVTLSIEHGVPNVIEEHVGIVPFTGHVRSILKENFKVRRARSLLLCNSSAFEVARVCL